MSANPNQRCGGENHNRAPRTGRNKVADVLSTSKISESSFFTLKTCKPWQITEEFQLITS